MKSDNQLKEFEGGEILGAVARGWTYPENASKVMDSDLANAIAKEVSTLIKEKVEGMRERWESNNKVTLGYATLKEARDYGYSQALQALLVELGLNDKKDGR